MPSARHNRRGSRRNRGRFGPLFKLLCALALAAALTVGATVFFRVEVIEVTGNSRYTVQEVAQASGIKLGGSLYAINKNAVARQVRQTLPYVEALSIWRGLPNKVAIQVTECQAAARVAAPSREASQAQNDQPEPDSSAASPPDGSEEKGESLEAAHEPWLISAAGKLLEPAPEDSAVMLVTGITPLAPRAGTMMALPQEEDAKRTALLSLLSALEELEALGNVSTLHLGDTRVEMRWLDRFDVRLPLNGDFSYLLRVLEKGVEETGRRHGEAAGGVMDLTQKDYELVYSPG